MLRLRLFRMIALPIFVITVLILVNSFYVAAEFAAVSVRSSQVRKLADEGNGLAAKLYATLSDALKLDRYIAACQIGITLSSLLLGAYAQMSLTPYLLPLLERLGEWQVVAANSLSAAIILIGLTVLQVVIGELMPKSIALQFPIQTALYTYYPMKWSLSLFNWFIKVLNGSGFCILKLLRVPPVTHRHIHSMEEIELLLDESRDGGLLAEDDHTRLYNALQMSALRIEQIMIPYTRLRMLELNATEDELIALISNDRDTHIPIYEGSRDNIVGILHGKELVSEYAHRHKCPPIREMVRQIPFLPEIKTVDTLLRFMREKNEEQAFVVDEYGKVTGLVTMERILEEMMGEIGEEFKPMQLKIEKLPDGSLRLPGMIRRHKIQKYFPKMKGQDMDANTLNGCIIKFLTKIPEDGEVFDFYGRRIIIERLENNRVASIIVLPQEEEKKEREGGGF